MDSNSIEIQTVYKQYEPAKEGFRDIADKYRITVEREDGIGLTELEIQTVLRLRLNELKDEI